MYKVAIAAGVLAIVPLTAYGQCARMVGSNQIICPGYANSTPPVYTGPGGHGPGRGALGVGQMAWGAGGAIWNGYRAYRGLPTPNIQMNAYSIANGYYNATHYPIVQYHPRIAYPAARPVGRPW
jgi:hypothetical protein